ncbi:MAG: PQQ-binding-like beta-propeller repeat protein [Phycisphaerales bacterium JB065]
MSKRAEPFQKLGYRLNWTTGDTSERNSRVKMIDIFDDLVLTHNEGNSVAARDLASGQVRWSANLGNPLTKFNGNVRLGDRIIASSESELLILDAKTGNLEDRQRLAVLSNTAPGIADQYMLIYGSARGEVFGHDTRVGLKRWGFALNDRVNGNPVVMGRIAGAVAESGQVLLVNPITGEAIAPLQQIYGGVVNNPVSDGVNMYIASTDQSIYAFESTTGELRWRVRTQSPLEAQPAVYDGALYQYVPSEGMIAVNTRTGKRLWTNDEVDGTVIAVRKGNLVVFNGSEMMLLDPASGDIRERVAVPGVRKIAIDGFVDGNLVVLSGNSALARFSSF